VGDIFKIMKENSAIQNTIAGKAVLQNEGQKDIPGHTKVDGVHHGKSHYTRNAEGNSLS
jgi:hypothetical protein